MRWWRGAPPRCASPGRSACCAPPVGKAWGETLGKHFPAMTLVQVPALIDPAAKVEIEGEALLP